MSMSSVLSTSQMQPVRDAGTECGRHQSLPLAKSSPTSARSPEISVRRILGREKSTSHRSHALDVRATLDAEVERLNRDIAAKAMLATPDHPLLYRAKKGLCRLTTREEFDEKTMFLDLRAREIEAEIASWDEQDQLDANAVS